MNYQEAKFIQAKRLEVVNVTEKELVKFEKGDFGLVKRTPEYIEAKDAFNGAFRKLKEINKFISLKFKKEESVARLARKVA